MSFENTIKQTLREMIAVIDGNRVEKGEIAQSTRQCLGVGAAGITHVEMKTG